MRLEMISKTAHRKFWNILLLLTFLITALLGLLLAIQVNYKLEIPYIKKILIFHVDFGIAMSLVAIIHLSWHLNYYLSLFKVKKSKEVQNNIQQEIVSNKIIQVKVPLIVLGFSASIIQVIMLREILSIFYSNELIFGIVLAIWMTLTGLGAWLGKQTKQQALQKSGLFIMFILLGLLPVLIVILLDILKNIFLPPGELINIWQLFIIITIILAPVCLLSGNIFRTLTITDYREKNNEGGKLYAIESIGSIIGGLIVSIVMIFWLNVLQSLIIVFTINVITAVISFSFKKRLVKIIIIFSAIIIAVFFFKFNFDLKIKQFLYTNQKVIETHETPYGNLTFTKTAGQINVFENLSLLFTTDNTMVNEETAHFPMLQHANPQDVLLVSGGIAGIAKEILKYSTVKNLVYIEPNPWLVKYALEYIKLPADNRLHVIFNDGRRFLKNDSSHYDVIIIALAEPSTLQINRYYSLEFIKLLKFHSRPGAVISLNLNSSADYLNNENRKLHSIIYKTLKSVFSNVIILQGEKDYFLCSDNLLKSEIGYLSLSKNMKNQYVNDFYLDDREIKEKSRSIYNDLNLNEPANTDFKPVATLVQSSLFMSKFNINSTVLISIVILILLIPMIKLKPVSFIMYTTGFTASSIEMIGIFVFQVMFGYLYAASGIIFSIFMAGLSMGAWMSYSLKKGILNKIISLQLMMVVMTFFVPFIILFIHKTDNQFITCLALFFIIFVTAFLTGNLFSAILDQLKVDNRDNTSYLYGTDLFGSALGLLVTTSILLPLLGLITSTIIIIGINIISLGFLVLSEKRWL